MMPVEVWADLLSRLRELVDGLPDLSDKDLERKKEFNRIVEKLEHETRFPDSWNKSRP